MDLSQLTPDEISALQEALNGLAQTPTAPVAENQGSEDDAILRIVEVLQTMQDKINAMDEEIDCLVKLVQEEIIDKIRESVDMNRRTSGIADLSTKYGDRFGPFKDAYGQLTGGKDIYAELFDELENARSGQADWTDEAENGKVEELLKGLTDRFGGIKDALGGGGKVTVQEVSAQPVGSSDTSGLMEAVKNMKKHGIPGLMPGSAS